MIEIFDSQNMGLIRRLFGFKSMDYLSRSCTKGEKIKRKLETLKGTDNNISKYGWGRFLRVCGLLRHNEIECEMDTLKEGHGERVNNMVIG